MMYWLKNRLLWELKLEANLMEPVILDKIPFKLGLQDVLKELKMDRDDENAEDVAELVEKANSIGCPKAVYKSSYIESMGDNFVIADGVKLTSRILKINLEPAHMIIPYIVTCGTELEAWAYGLSDMLEQYWADIIRQMILNIAVNYTLNRIKSEFNITKTGRMNPGSLEDWPISQQKELFRMLGDPYNSIGVKLTESYLMLPVKSVSGILFPTDTEFENCRLCPRENCPRRNAPYDKSLVDRYK